MCGIDCDNQTVLHNSFRTEYDGGCNNTHVSECGQNSHKVGLAISLAHCLTLASSYSSNPYGSIISSLLCVAAFV